MKKFIIALLASAALVTLNLGAQKAQTFTGEIMDQQCALLRGHSAMMNQGESAKDCTCLLYTSPSPRDLSTSRMPSSA